MLPLANILLHPLAHGAVGFLDEILNLIPLVFGSGLLFYLYFSKRKRPAPGTEPHAAHDQPPAPPDEPPPP